MFLDFALMFPHVVIPSDKLLELREGLTEYQLINVPLEIATLMVDQYWHSIGKLEAIAQKQSFALLTKLAVSTSSWKCRY